LTHSGLAGGRGKEIHVCSGELQEFVLKYGRFHEPQALPDCYELRAPRSCFGNASFLAVTRDLRYAEGFAFASDAIHLFHHAWCLDDDNRVVDPTWGCGLAYRGVVFDSAFACRWVGRVPNALGLTARAWSEAATNLPTPPTAGPDKPLPLLRVAKAGWRTNVAPVGVLPNGPRRYVVFGIEPESLKPIKKAICAAGMVLTGETRHEVIKQFWAISVSSDGGPKVLPTLDRIAWDEWWAINAASRSGIHPNKTLLRALSYKVISEGWPPAARKRRVAG
jgi:hypothetical protein